MNHIARLEDWFQTQRETNGLVDIKFFPGSDREAMIEATAKVVFEAVTIDPSETIDLTTKQF